MNRIILVFAVLSISLVSCKIDPCFNKQYFVKEYEKFTDKIFEEYEDYSEKDWETKDERMESFLEDCYEKHSEKLSEDEKKDIWISYFKYKYYRHGQSVLKAIESDAKEYSIEIDKELEEIFNDPEEDVKKILKELYGDDINEAIDEFIEGIQNIGDLIKEWLEDK